MRQPRFVVAACFLILGGCTQSAESPTQPTQQTFESLNPEDVEVGELLYTWCRSGWGDGEMPSAERLSVDIYFNAEHADEPVTAEQEQAILERGGSVIYTYDAPVLRAEMPTSEIPDLFGGPGGLVNHVRSVPNPDRTDLAIIVMYEGPVQESDLERIAELGGRVDRTYTVIDGLSADFPDQSLSELRAEDRVHRIGLDSALCLG